MMIRSLCLALLLAAAKSLAAELPLTRAAAVKLRDEKAGAVLAVLKTARAAEMEAICPTRCLIWMRR